MCERCTGKREGSRRRMSSLKKERRRRTLLVWAGGIIVVALVLWRFGQPPVGPYEGERAPQATLTLLDSGERIELSSLRGKPVFINFWATWCLPCREEMPAIQALYDEHPGAFHVVAVSDEPAETVRAYVEEFGFTFPIYLDPRGEMGRAYHVLAMPTSLFLDEAGVIRARHIGQMTREQMEQYLRQLVRNWNS